MAHTVFKNLRIENYARVMDSSENLIINMEGHFALFSNLHELC